MGRESQLCTGNGGAEGEARKSQLTGEEFH